MANPKLKLKNANFHDLFEPLWLGRFDEQFLAQLQQQNRQLYVDLIAYRHRTRDFSPEEISALLLACAPLAEEHIAELFGIEQALSASAQATLSQQPIFAFKQWYVVRQARKRLLKQDFLSHLRS